MTNASDATVDFGDIPEGGGGKVRVPEGDYKAKIKAVSFQTSQSGNPMFVWIIVGTAGKLKGKELKEYTTLTKKSLWKLRDLMEATIGKTPDKKVSTRALLAYCKKNMIGKEIGVTLEDDEFTTDKGKSVISSKISDYIDVDDVDGKSSPDDDAEEDDDDVEDEESDEEEEDEDDGLDDKSRVELKAHIKSEKLEVKVLKSMSDDDIRAAIRATSGDDEEIEDVDLDEL